MLLTTLLFAALARAAVPTDMSDVSLFFEDPPTRGHDMVMAQQAPCGGFARGEDKYWASKGDMKLHIDNEVSNIRFNVWQGDNVDSKVQIGYVPRAKGNGTICLPDDVQFRSQYGFQFGTELTLQVVYYDESKGLELYNCADIHLTSPNAYEHPVNHVCSNSTWIESSTDNTALAVNNGRKGLSPVAAGFVGMAATLGFVALVVALLKWRGLLSFSKVARERVPANHWSTRYENPSSDSSLQHQASMAKA